MSKSPLSHPVQIVTHPLVQDKLSRLRDVKTEHGEFRRHMAAIGYHLFYEAARDMPTRNSHIQTPLEAVESPLLGSDLVLVAVLRAGLGFLDGILPGFPEARVGYLGLSRDPKSLEAHLYYQNVPPIKSDDHVFMLDPMLATGHTALSALDYLDRAGARNIKLVCLVASPEGIDVVRSRYPQVMIYTAGVDRELNGKGYILPGLGDAGDRLYGTLGH
jgi:uracil phosphoribosyltransferase